MIAFGLWYMKRELQKSLQRGEVYDSQDEADTTAASVGEEDRLPPIGTSITPILLIITIIFIGSFFKVQNIIVIALAISILFSALTLGRYTKSQKEVINEGAQGAISPIFFTAAAVGFGTVVTAAPGFKVMSDFILQIPGNPIISLAIVTSLTSIITGSASGSLGIIMPSFANVYLDMGIHPDVLHRIATMASGPLSLLPHSGVVLTFLALTGLNHKNTYKYIFLSTVVGSLLALLAALALALILY
ncbi:MAG: Na+/H+ antiporter NhaC family protein [Desulfitobacterium sp.]